MGLSVLLLLPVRFLFLLSVSCRLSCPSAVCSGYSVELSALLLLPVCFLFLLSVCCRLSRPSAVVQVLRVVLSALACFLFVSFVVWLYSSFCSFVCIVYRYIFLQFKQGFLSLAFVFRAFCGFWVVYGFFIIASSPDFPRLLRVREKFF